MRASLPLVGMLLAAAGCDRPDGQAQGPAGPAVNAEAPRASDQPGVTPMAQRVAVLGFLNKRNGIVRDLALRPGQSVRLKDAIVRLRACEATAPWESQTLTGAFVQLDVQRTDGQWSRVFSGWLYKESPSLNVVEHPVYDVWPKSCAMAYPAGPDAPAAPAASSNRSSARRSGGGTAASPPPAEAPAPEPAAPEPAVPPSAPVNNAT